MTTVVERLELLITSSAKGAVDGLKETGAASTALDGKFGKLGEAMGKIGIGSNQLGTAMKVGVAGAAVFAGAAVGKFALDGISQFADLTSQVRAFQRVSGATAEDSSKLVFATKELGIAPDAAASAFGRLETRIGTGKADLDQYGIATKDASGKTLDAATIVANISDAYQNAGDQTTKAAIGNEAFGKSWQTLAPLLGKGADDLKKIYDEAGTDHQIFSQDDLEKGREYTVAIKQLGNAFTGLKIELGEAFVPLVTQATSGLTQGLQAADKATSAFGGLGGAISATTEGLNPFNLGAHGAAATSALLAGHFEDAGKNALEAVPFFGGYASALFDGSDASNKFTDAQDRQKKAIATAADLVTQGKEHTKEYADAVKTAKTASDELSGASDKLATSLETEAEKTQAAADKTFILLDAHLKAEGSVLAIGDALSTYAQAQKDAADAGGLDADANRKVTESSLSVAEAVEAAAAAKGTEAEASSTATTAEGKHQAGIAATLAALNFFSGGLDSTTKAYLQPYIDKLNDKAMNSTHTAGIAVTGYWDAIIAINQVEAALDRIDGRVINAVVNVGTKLQDDVSKLFYP